MSKNENSTSVQVGPGAATCLTILFVLLKVFGYINWSWWWVFAPMWMGAALVLIIMSGILLASLVCLIIAAVLENKR